MTIISRFAGQGWRRAVVSTLALLGTLGAAATPKLDGLLSINDAPSPCLSVRVRVFENTRLRTEVAVMPDGRVNLLGGKGATAPHFRKGQTYNLQGMCVSTSNLFQNSELTFKAEGRTVMVVFTKAGFQFRRGGLAY